MRDLGQQGLLTILLVVLALVGVTAVTAAWFSIADNTRLAGVSMNVTSGTSLRFDLDPHADYMDYGKTLTFDQVAQRVLREKGFDPRETPLEPVTTEDGANFFTEEGEPVPADSGKYLEFTLHFMSQDDMLVHLTSAPGSDGAPGTLLSSETEGLSQAMRVSFTAGGTTRIYDPGLGNARETAGAGTVIFGLASGSGMVYNADNTLFPLTDQTDQPVVVRLWLEGTDEACTNALKGAEYTLELRFEGTDNEYHLFSD